jgi:hypothetical protein
VNHTPGSLESVGGDDTGPVCHARKPGLTAATVGAGLAGTMDEGPAPPVVRAKTQLPEITAERQRHTLGRSPTYG